MDARIGHKKVAVRQFTWDFAECYADPIQKCSPVIDVYRDAAALIKRNFPSLTISS